MAHRGGPLPRRKIRTAAVSRTRPCGIEQEDIMRSRLLFGSILMVAILATGAIATSGDRGGPSRQWAATFLLEPTLIGSTIVQGPVLFVHDEAKMARGEPCT